MAKNPETKVTDDLKTALSSCGGYFMKVSDSYSRGIPDSFIAVPQGLWAVEIKVDRTKGTLCTRTYKSLGASGAQDHRLRQVARVAKGHAYIFTNTVDLDRPILWSPVNPEREGEGFEDYMRIADGWESVLFLMGFTGGL